jgi:hypothetical protein
MRKVEVETMTMGVSLAIGIMWTMDRMVMAEVDAKEGWQWRDRGQREGAAVPTRNDGSISP